MSNIIQSEEQAPHRGLFYLAKSMYPQKSSDVLGQLNTFRQNRRNPMDYLRESETRLGLPSSRERLAGLRGAISNTENLLRNVDPSVTGRTQGSLVTEAQRNRMVANERAPIADQFREQSRALEGETANLSELGQRSMAEAQLGIGEQQAQEQSLQGLYNLLFGREQEEEKNKQWWEQFNEGKRQADRQANELAAQTAALRNAIKTSNQVPTAVPTPSSTPLQVSKEYSNSGKITGYDTNYGSSLTDYGKQLEDENWRKMQESQRMQNIRQSLPEWLRNTTPGLAITGVRNFFGI